MLGFGRVWTTVLLSFWGDVPCENSCTCFQMYFRKAVLDHLRIRMIEKTGTPARYMAIAAPERMDLVQISDRQMPSFVLPIVNTPSRHKSAIISAVTLMILFLCLPERLGNFCLPPVRQNSPRYWCPNFDGVQKLFWWPPLSDSAGLSVIFLSFESDQKCICQMKRGNDEVKKGFTISDESDIPDALLLYRRLALLCFRYFCVLVWVRHPEVGDSCKFTIAWQSSVDFEERMSQSMQTWRAFCCTSFGLSFLYDLCWRRRCRARTLRSVSRLGLSCLFSLKLIMGAVRICLYYSY